MNQKHIGIVILLVGVLMSLFVYLSQQNEESHINEYILEKGSCFMDSGKCLHADRGYGLYIFGYSISISLVLFGLYLTFFDKTQEFMFKHQEVVSKALSEAKNAEKNKDEFKAFLSGFNEDEKLVLSAIKEQDGILQSTLRYKTGITKSSLSLLLKSLEEREIISRKENGKSNKVFLRKKF